MTPRSWLIEVQGKAIRSSIPADPAMRLLVAAGGHSWRWLDWAAASGVGREWNRLP